jgi:hypothetical protein
MEGEQVQVDVSSVILSDIDDKRTTLSDFKGQVVVLSGGAKAAADQAEEWLHPLAKELGAMKDVKYAPIAFVGKLPPFIPKGMIKSDFKKMAVMPLIAWDDVPQKTMGLVKKNVSHVYVLDKQGMLRFRLAAPFSDENLKTVMGQVRKFAV